LRKDWALFTTLFSRATRRSKEEAVGLYRLRQNSSER